MFVDSHDDVPRAETRETDEASSGNVESGVTDRLLEDERTKKVELATEPLEDDQVIHQGHNSQGIVGQTGETLCATKKAC